MNEEALKNYYNKFNEDKRLKTRHGQVEFLTTMKYINKYLKSFKKAKILDIGAGTGAYSIPLASKGHDVTAVELVKHNLKVIEQRSKDVKCVLGNALDLSKFANSTFDIVLLFGPLYHLISTEEKVKALKEAKRVLKENGYIFVAYCMNDYRVITHGFKEREIKNAKELGLLSKDYHVLSRKDDLYSAVRLEDINELNQLADLKRVKIITPDGPANYIRPFLNKLNEEEFSLFLDYHFKTCERLDLLGAAAHSLDILKK